MDELCFSLKTERDGTTLCLKLIGEFDWAATGHVEGALENARCLPLEHVVFDLSALTFIDLSGLKVILAADERAQAGGFDVKVVRPRGLANRIFTLTRAGDSLAMADRL
ncbi:MAG: STAS domain-containing protein, partial [Thermoleophilaceae bacterium]|nr:STAS domain-containing protein [Thermoleophilaceae bacterium]